MAIIKDKFLTSDKADISELTIKKEKNNIALTTTVDEAIEYILDRTCHYYYLPSSVRGVSYEVSTRDRYIGSIYLTDDELEMLK